ncbi:MAG: hypothetical protein EA383_16585 [Spirochaetaceae bacterium]|nr:MAG: hypothetical protein EA383_16585 [Spirochaetaceae bacterium]
MKKYYAIALVVGLVLLAGCVTPPSLQTPRPLPPGDVQLGVHGTALFPPRLLGDDNTDLGEAVFTGTPTFTGRYGLIDNLEIGANVGGIGVYGTLKYGLLPYSSPFQLSVLGGYGRWGFVFLPTAMLEDGMEPLNYPSFDIGALMGYEFDQIIGIYGGARHYWIGNAQAPFGRFQTTNVIIGGELLPGQRFSFPVEMNFGILNTLSVIEEVLGENIDEPDENFTVVWPSLNFGVTVRF